MIFLQNTIILLLILTVSTGLLGLFFYSDYLKKMSCLSVSFISLIVLFIIIAKNSAKAKDLYIIIGSIIIIFSISLITGIGIISNISRLEEVSDKKKNT